MVITGTKSSELVGELMAPPTFPDEPYTLDATTYIFVLENMMIEGAVQVMVENFTIHPKSWLTVSNNNITVVSVIVDSINYVHYC